MSTQYYQKFKISVAGVSHDIYVTDSETVLLEMETGRSMEIIRNDQRNSDVVMMAYFYLRRLKTPGIPEDFRDFLMLGVQIDVDSLTIDDEKSDLERKVGDAAGEALQQKRSVPALDTGSSPAWPSKPVSAQQT